MTAKREASSGVDPVRSKRSRAARRKGHTFEREIANSLKGLFPDAHRQPQSQIKLLKEIAAGNAVLAAAMCLTDVVAGPYGIECKHRKTLPDPLTAYAQAVEDVGKSGKIPLLVMKGGRLKRERLKRGQVLCYFASTEPVDTPGNLLVLDWYDDVLPLLEAWAEASARAGANVREPVFKVRFPLPPAENISPPIDP